MTRPWERWWAEVESQDHMRTSNQLQHPVRKIFVQKASEVGKTVLEVGCATAIDYPLFKEANISYTGIDITEKFVERARKLNPNIDIKHGDAFNLPFTDESYDTVYCKDLLEHLPSEAYIRVINEMWRVTRHLMMISFYIPLTNKRQTKYIMSPHGFYVNEYSKEEMNRFLRGLEYFNDLEIIDINAKFTPCTLYTARKKTQKTRRERE